MTEPIPVNLPDIPVFRPMETAPETSVVELLFADGSKHIGVARFNRDAVAWRPVMRWKTVE